MAKCGKETTTKFGQAVWKSRIVGHDRVDPSSLVANPLNYRTHPQAQREALSQAIGQLGFLRSVTVNRRTGNLVDGHERVWQALTTEQPLIDVEYVDLSETEERAALATLDPLSEMATTDAAKLDELLRDVSVSGEALQQMLADLASEWVPWIGDPGSDGAGSDEQLHDTDAYAAGSIKKFEIYCTAEEFPEVKIDIEHAKRLSEKESNSAAILWVLRGFREGH